MSSRYVTNRLDSVTLCPMLSNGNSFSNGQSMNPGTERECPLIRRILQAVEDRR